MFGYHSLYCIICNDQNNTIVCKDELNGIESCRFIINHVCKKCKKSIREKIQFHKNLKNYKCNHVKSISSKLCQEGTYLYDKGYYTNILHDYVQCCKICLDEICKEQRLRKKIKITIQYNNLQYQKIIQQNSRSLTERCAHVISINPRILLEATTRSLKDDIWNTIYETMNSNDNYYEELIESVDMEKKNMYAALSYAFELMSEHFI